MKFYKKYCFVLNKKYIFVAFHFYFLLDLFQTATLHCVCSFFILKNSGFSQTPK